MTPEEYKRYWLLIEAAAHTLQAKFAQQILECDGPPPLGPLVLHREDKFRLRQSWQAYHGCPIHSIDIVLVAANLRRDQATDRRWAIHFGSADGAGEGVAIVVEEHTSNIGVMRKSQPNGTSYARLRDPNALLKSIAGNDVFEEKISSDMADPDAFTLDPMVLLKSIRDVPEDLIERISKDMADQISTDREAGWEDDLRHAWEDDAKHYRQRQH